MQTEPIIYSALTDSEIDFEIRRLKGQCKNTKIRFYKENCRAGIEALKAEKEHRRQCREIEALTQEANRIIFELNNVAPGSILNADQDELQLQDESSPEWRRLWKQAEEAYAKLETK